MHEHTFIYTDKADFVQQMQALLAKLQDMEPYAQVRKRYPHIRTPGAFSNRLKRFKGEFPKEMSEAGGRIIKLTVTSELHQYLAK